MKRKLILLGLGLLIIGMIGCTDSTTSGEQTTTGETDIESVLDSEEELEFSQDDESTSKNNITLNPEDIEILSCMRTADTSVALSLEFNYTEDFYSAEDFFGKYDLTLTANYEGTDHTQKRVINNDIHHLPGLVDVLFTFDSNELGVGTIDFALKEILFNLTITDKEDGTVLYSEEPKTIDSFFAEPLGVFMTGYSNALEAGLIENYDKTIDFTFGDINLSITNEMDFLITATAIIRNKTDKEYKVPNLHVNNKSSIYILTPDIEEIKAFDSANITFTTRVPDVGDVYLKYPTIIVTMTDGINRFNFALEDDTFYEQLKTFSTNVE